MKIEYESKYSTLSFLLQVLLLCCLSFPAMKSTVLCVSHTWRKIKFHFNLTELF